MSTRLSRGVREVLAVIALVMVAVFALYVLIVTGQFLFDGPESVDDRDDRRYLQCLEAGGSYSGEGREFSCEVP